MSHALFPGNSFEEDEQEMRDFAARSDGAVFVIERDNGLLAGYAEVGTRSIADGCKPNPVGYIEAWYVDPDIRRSGFGRQLIEAGEQWAKEQGYTEMASDALLENDVSHAAHRRIGFEEVARVINYRKDLYAKED